MKTPNNNTCLLGIDIGTSSLKLALIDLSGKRLAEYRSASSILQPAPGFVEQDPEAAWWQAVQAGARHCLDKSGVAAENVAGICASGMVPNLCGLDEDGTVVRPAILYRDNRAIAEVQALQDAHGVAFTQQDVLPKLLWLKNNEPGSYARIATVLNTHSYIAYKLTGKLSSDHDTAGIFGGVYDEENRRWMPDLMEKFGLSPKVLPPLYDALDVVGEVTPAAAAATGLAAGTPVIAGTGDSYTAFVGAGVVGAGEGLIYLGTAGTFLGLKRPLAELMRQKSPFVTGDAVFVANVLMGAEISRWFKDDFLGLGDMPIAALDAEAATVPPGADGLFALPHLLGERTPVKNPLAKGVLFGLTNAHTRAHAYRAFLEGVAYAFRQSFDAAGVPLSRVVVCGGGANCVLWRQIIASVLGREMEFIPAADNVLGTAYLAGLALGLFDGFAPIRDVWLKEKETVPPDAAMQAVYERDFPFYKNLNILLRPAYERLAALGY